TSRRPDVKKPTSALIASVHVVPELRLGPEVLLEPEDLLVRQHPADLAVGIEEIAKDARAGGAGLHARGIPPLARALDAERALLDHATLPQAIAEIVLVWVHLVGGHHGLAPVEAARVVGAGGDAVAAADAPVVVHHHDAVRLHPRRLHRADVHARRVLAVEALRADVEVAGRGHLVGKVVLGVAEVDLPLLVLVDANILDGGLPVLIVLLHAAADAVHVAAALRDVEGVAIEHARPRPRGRDVHALPRAQLVQALEPLHRVGLLVIGH